MADGAEQGLLPPPQCQLSALPSCRLEKFNCDGKVEILTNCGRRNVNWCLNPSMRSVPHSPPVQEGQSQKLLGSIKPVMLKTHSKGENPLGAASPSPPPRQHLLPKSLPVSKGKKEK